MYILLDIILFLIIFSYLFDGWRKGLALTGLNIIGYLISIFICNKLAHIFTETLVKYTNILNFLHKHMDEWLDKVKNEYILRLFDGLDMLVFSYTFIDVFGFIILFFIVSNIMGQIIKRLNKLMPFDFLDIVDRLVGSILGMFRGFLMIFILLALLVQLIEVDENLVLKETLDQTTFVKGLYENNPIIGATNRMR